LHYEVIETEQKIMKLFNIDFSKIETSGKYMEGTEMNKLEEVLEELYFQAQKKNLK
jgi:hypothetical protein